LLNKAPKVSALLNGRRWIRFAIFIVIGLFLITAPQFIGTAFVSLITKFFIFAMLTMSLDIVFGYAGLWSFCHAAIFGVAGYTAGILAIHLGITSFWLTAAAGILMALVTAAIFGVIALRVSKLYFLIVTLALGQLIYGIALKWKSVTNGYDGLWNVPFPPDIFISNTPVHYYYFTLIVAVIFTVLLYLITRSPFGHSLEGIRDNETRMRSLGYNTWLFKCNECL
jgi:branched-chain amino acid transport system permease protein